MVGDYTRVQRLVQNAIPDNVCDLNHQCLLSLKRDIKGREKDFAFHRNVVLDKRTKEFAAKKQKT